MLVDGTWLGDDNSKAKTNAGELTRAALPILIERSPPGRTVPFPTAWRARAALCEHPIPAVCVSGRLPLLAGCSPETALSTPIPCPCVWTGISAGSRSCWRGLSWRERRDGARLVPTSGGGSARRRIPAAAGPSRAQHIPDPRLLSSFCRSSRSKSPRVSPVPGPVRGHRAHPQW